MCNTAIPSTAAMPQHQRHNGVAGLQAYPRRQAQPVLCCLIGSRQLLHTVSMPVDECC